MTANPYPAIAGDGGLVPPDLRGLVYALSPDLDGGDRHLTAPASFGIDGRDRRAVDEAIGRAWNRAADHWRTFSGYRADVQKAIDAGTRTGARHPGLVETRDHLLLPVLRLLGYDPEARRDGDEVGGRRYTFTHRDGDLPIHLTTFLDTLDDSPTYGPAPAAIGGGARKAGPHAAMQEYLNRREGATYGLVSNGRTLRLLAPNPSLTRLQYLEFDLEAIFEGDLYPDFRLLWLLVHRTRLIGAPDARPPLDAWREAALATGTRAMAGLRAQVHKALLELGTGLVTHPRNGALRAALRDGTLTPAQVQSGLLTVLYRLLFLFVAEARGQLHPPEAGNEARTRYEANYGLTRLRAVARRHVGDTRHADLWLGFDLVCTLLGDTDGSQATRRGVLGLPALGGLFARNPFPGVGGVVHVANTHFATAIHHLSVVNVKEGKGKGRTTLRRVNYADLDVEELGGIYEGLLELVPEVVAEEGAASFRFAGDTAGGDRKQSGSYYTPRDLVGALVRSTLDPVIEDRLRGATTPKAREAAILGITVCDPACGSGHFLLAAAERLAGELASVRADGREPSVTEVRQARRDVIGHCLYGVDLNPMAVDLCKVALWLAGYHAGRPLGFLDHRIRCGNSLVGVSPDKAWLRVPDPSRPVERHLFNQGLPDKAFAVPSVLAGTALGGATEAAVKAVVTDLTKANRQEVRQRAAGTGQTRMRFDAPPDFETLQTGAGRDVAAIVDRDDATVADVAGIARDYAAWQAEAARLRAGFDAWVAAFFWPVEEVAARRAPGPPTTADFARPDAAAVPPTLRQPGQREMVAALAARHRFFHWPIEFPEVFAKGGFDCILGNPPWERIKLQEQEFFAARDAEIANAKNAAARKAMIGRLPVTNPGLWRAYAGAIADAEATSQFVRTSGRYARTGTGDVNLYALFAEHARDLVNGRGRAGVIVPTGIATDDTTKVFFGHLVETEALATLFDFENGNIFEAVDSRMKFCLMTLSGAPVPRGDLAFFLHDVAELRGDTGRRFQLSPADFALINPNTKTCPTFRTRADADLTRQIYGHVPVLIKEPGTDKHGRAVAGENPWGVRFMRMLDMSNDSGLFHDAPGAGRVPLYEGKMFDFYNHRFASAVRNSANAQRQSQQQFSAPDELGDPKFQVTPLYYVDNQVVTSKLDDKSKYLLAFKDITSPTNERTFVCAILPRSGTGNKAPLIFSDNQTYYVFLLTANLSSLVLDYSARQKIGGITMNFYLVKQFPVLPPERYDAADRAFIVPRVVELTYTAWDVQAFARDMGMDGAPFRWDDDRRAVMRAELDAWYAMKYGLTRKQLRYVLDPHQLTAREIETLVADDTEDAPDAPRVAGFPGETFRVLKDREIKTYREFRTARLVMEAWDALSKAGWDPSRYASPLRVPPGDARARHGG
ncbi:MAG: N-6 DNA methylase [Chloroflexi bacterium]|nr:N-6 DNA methylase [Chloroflexota bacterium]